MRCAGFIAIQASNSWSRCACSKGARTRNTANSKLLQHWSPPNSDVSRCLDVTARTPSGGWAARRRRHRQCDPPTPNRRLTLVGSKRDSCRQGGTR
eukprot:12404381-Alexandrium_andersonii.AAC.1